LTSIQSVLAAFAIILIDLLGRAGLDKVLALSGGPAIVAHWAQLQSVVELVCSVALAGVLQGLTVLIAQVRATREESILLRATLKLGLGTSLSVALGVMLVAGHISGEIKPDMFVVAALAGVIAVIPATLNSYWLGKHRQQRMLGLVLLTSTVLLAVAAGAWFGLPLRGLVWVQCIMLAIIGSLVWRYLRTLSRGGAATADETQYVRRLANFVPVGIAIGIMSPVSMLLVRGMLSGTLSWDEVGNLQALWRSAEWVTATAAGVLSLVFLPRFSSAFDIGTGGSARFGKEVMRAGMAVLIPAALLLLLIYHNQQAMLATLYDVRFSVSDKTAALFLLGSWIRVASWLFLFGLYAVHRTRLIMAGEVLSLPLYALLLWLFADGMTLERAALLYLASFVIYLGFNAGALLYAARHPETGRPDAGNI